MDNVSHISSCERCNRTSVEAKGEFLMCEHCCSNEGFEKANLAGVSICDADRIVTSSSGLAAAKNSKWATASDKEEGPSRVASGSPGPGGDRRCSRRLGTSEFGHFQPLA